MPATGGHGDATWSPRGSGCGALTRSLARRGLSRTAEATSVLAVALLAVLVNGSWRGGLLGGDGLVVFAAIATTVGATVRCTGLSLLTTPTVAQLMADPDDLGRLAATVAAGAVLAAEVRSRCSRRW